MQPIQNLQQLEAIQFHDYNKVLKVVFGAELEKDINRGYVLRRLRGNWEICIQKLNFVIKNI